MEILFYTIFVGLALLACGFYLGRQGEDLMVAAALKAFIEEMIKAKVINEKKLTAYILKNYGGKLDL